MIFFTSDLHFGHSNIIKYCKRPFVDTKEMDEEIIKKWNKKVAKNDTVYILGDIALSKESLFLVKKLNGKKHLIIGNHDFYLLDEIYKLKCFESINYMEVILLNDKILTLCHFPTYSFIGDWLIYGHVHNNEADKSWLEIRRCQNTLNAGCEINNYVPVTFEELKENNKMFLTVY